MAVVFLDVGDQRLVEHETVDEPLVERLERYVPGAEVIERNTHAEFA